MSLSCLILCFFSPLNLVIICHLNPSLVQSKHFHCSIKFNANQFGVVCLNVSIVTEIKRWDAHLKQSIKLTMRIPFSLKLADCLFVILKIDWYERMQQKKLKKIFTFYKKFYFFCSSIRWISKLQSFILFYQSIINRKYWHNLL